MSLSTFFTRSPTSTDIPLLPLFVSQPSSPSQIIKTIQPGRPPRMTSNSSPLPQSDALLSLSRQEAHIQSTLQHLLDAQNEGLLAGLAGGPPPDDTSSIGSRTPTTESELRFQKGKSVIPIRQPRKKKMGLRGARRGITRAMAQLASLKGEEEKVLEDEVARRDDMISTVEKFDQKSTGLQQQIQGIESEESSRRVKTLKQEEKTLGNDIHQLETKLYEMRARHRHLIREIDGLSNSVQSKLSSYESALALANRDIQEFLTRPPIEEPSVSKTGIWALPKERRTLEMAKEFFTEERQNLKSHQKAIQAETSALEKGGRVWEEVVQEVNQVEKALREEMQQIQTPLVQTSDETPPTATTGMNKILQTMRKARSRISEHLDHAETNNWKLLVCCIGAELEALIEGQAVLESALGISHSDIDSAEQHDGNKSRQQNGASAAEGVLIDDGITAGVIPQDTTPSPAHGYLDRSEDEDDGPGPELLISHHGD